jgi:hypothetical protein
MLKKLGIAVAIASVVTVGAAGVAYAGDYDDHKSDHKSHDSGDDSDDNGDDSDDNDSGVGIDCSSEEYTEQNNYGKQLIGGNINLRNIAGFIGAAIDHPAVCPKVANDNEIHFVE